MTDAPPFLPLYTHIQLSELKEAADAAEEAMGGQAEEVQRLKKEVAQFKVDMKAKDERIRKLDAVKLTTDQVEKLRKIKEEHAKFSADVSTTKFPYPCIGLLVLWEQYISDSGPSICLYQNKKLRQELEFLKQQAASNAASAESGTAEALDAQSKTIAEIMTVRDSLQEKLRTSTATCRKLELERLSVLETLQDIPINGMRFDQVS